MIFLAANSKSILDNISGEKALMIMVIFVIIIWGTIKFYVMKIEDEKTINLWMVLIIPFIFPLIFGLLIATAVWFTSSSTINKSYIQIFGEVSMLIFLSIYIWAFIVWNRLRQGKGALLSSGSGDHWDNNYMRKLIGKMFIIPGIGLVIFVIYYLATSK